MFIIGYTPWWVAGLLLVGIFVALTLFTEGVKKFSNRHVGPYPMWRNIVPALILGVSAHSIVTTFHTEAFFDYEEAKTVQEQHIFTKTAINTELLEQNVLGHLDAREITYTNDVRDIMDGDVVGLEVTKNSGDVVQGDLSIDDDGCLRLKVYDKTVQDTTVRIES